MDELDELASELKVQDTRLTDNNMSSKEKRKKAWREFRKSYDWEKFPLHVLITAILLIGAYLMGMSVYMLTGSFIVAILSPAFSELGLTAAHLASNRPKNSVRQKEISRRLRNWHIGTSVVLLISNLVVETATQLLSIKIDGVIYVIFGIIGLTSLIDIISYFNYQDHDDEMTIKGSHAKELEGIKSQTLKSKMEAFRDAEKIKAEEEVKFWKETAPELAKYKARIEAAKEIKKLYVDLGMSADEVKSLLNDVGVESGEEVLEEIPNQKRSYNKTGRFKKTQVKDAHQKEADSFFQGETSQLEERAKKLDFPIPEE